MLRHRILPGICALSLAMAAVACGGDGNGDGDGLTLDKLDQEVARVYCAKLFECCTDEELEAYTFEDEAGCRTSMESMLTELMVTPIRNAVDADRGQYDPAKAQKCLEAFEALGCVGTNDPDAFFENCADPYVATQEIGDPCASQYECKLDAYCVAESGNCEALLAEGATCTTDGEPPCQAELYCDGTSCVPRIAEGETCTESRECTLGLKCEGGTCVTPEPKCTGR